MKSIEPWLLAQGGGHFSTDSKNFETEGIEPTGVAGGSDERDMRRWKCIAGLTEGEV